MGKESVQVSTVTLDVLDGGLNSNWLSSSMNDNESRDCNGTIWMDHCLQPTPGWVRLTAQIGGTGSTADINNITDYRMRDGTQYLFVIAADKAYYYDVATSKYIDITGVAHTQTDTLTRTIVFNERLIGTNGTDTILDWIPGGDLLELSASCGADIPPASARYVTTFNGRVVFLNYVDGATPRPTRACYSALDNQNFYDLAFNFWEVDGDDGDFITGGSQLGDDFIIFTNNTINIVSGSGTPWTVSRGFIKGVGCVSGDSVVRAHIRVGGNLTECIIFMSHDGPKVFDGSNVHSLPIMEEGRSYKCQAYFDTLNSAYRQNALSVYYPRRNWVGFFHPTGTSTTNNAGAFFNPDTNSLWPIDSVRAKCCTRVWNNSTHVHDVYIGAYDGCIYYLSETDKSLEASTELIANGGFELDADATSPPTSWTALGTPTTCETDDNDTITPYQGTKQLKIVTASTGQGAYQNITTVAGSKYRLHAWLYISTGSVKCTAGATDSSTLTAVAAWQRLKFDFTASSTTTKISFSNPATNVSTYWIDDVSVRCIDISPYWESKYFDFGDEATVKYLREVTPFTTVTTGGSLNLQLTYDKGSGLTSTDSINLAAGIIDWALVDWSYVDWTSVEEISKSLDSITQDSFRTLRVRLMAGAGMTNFKFNKLIFSAKELGKRWFYC